MSPNSPDEQRIRDHSCPGVESEPPVDEETEAVVSDSVVAERTVESMVFGFDVPHPRRPDPG